MPIRITISSARYSSTPFPVSALVEDYPGPGVPAAYSADVTITWTPGCLDYAGNPSPAPSLVDHAQGKAVWVAQTIPASGSATYRIDLVCAGQGPCTIYGTAVDPSLPTAMGYDSDSLTRDC